MYPVKKQVDAVLLLKPGTSVVTYSKVMSEHAWHSGTEVIQ